MAKKNTVVKQIVESAAVVAAKKAVRKRKVEKPVEELTTHAIKMIPLMNKGQNVTFLANVTSIYLTKEGEKKEFKNSFVPFSCAKDKLMGQLITRFKGAWKVEASIAKVLGANNYEPMAVIRFTKKNFNRNNGTGFVFVGETEAEMPTFQMPVRTEWKHEELVADLF